jgi:hypothetical protein
VRSIGQKRARLATPNGDEREPPSSLGKESNMPKGFFTQAAYLLLEQAFPVATLQRALQRHDVLRAHEAVGGANSGWMGGFANVLLPLRREVNGYLTVDLIERRYPDGMGDPKEAPDLFGAWATGWMGPFTYPGNLARAVRMCGNREAITDAVDRHAAMVRILSSYTLGAIEKDHPILPADYHATQELERITEVARSVFEIPGALAYFNSGGETIFTKSSFDAVRDYHRSAGLLPLPLWSCVRLFNLSDHPGWTLMDTVGMEQLDTTDMEACFQHRSFDPAEVAKFLRNATDYFRQKGPVIKDGDTMDGPGNVRWQALAFEHSFAQRPRATIRWLPLAGLQAPSALVTRPGSSAALANAKLPGAH